MALAVVALIAAVPAAGQQLDLREVCGPYTPLTLIGLDTAASTALFAMAATDAHAGAGIQGWMVELRVADAQVQLYPDWKKQPRLGGSVGPGPVLTAASCGAGCLQLQAWQGGGWQRLGPPLTVPTDATAFTARDGGGDPWVVAHQPTAYPGQPRATAWRLAGGRWSERGSRVVAGVGAPAARPQPGTTDAVVTGSGRFRRAAEADSWVAGLPGVPAEERGQLVPLAGGEVAYLSRAGSVYLSSDGGTTWRRSRWTPWSGMSAGPPPTAVDLPTAAAGLPLSLAWFDRSEPQKLFLSQHAAGGWRLHAALPALEPVGAETVGFSHLLRLADGRWLLVAGCEVTPRGCALRTVLVGADGATERRVLRLQPTWLD